MRVWYAALVTVALLISQRSLSAPTEASTTSAVELRADGTIRAPAFELPLSSYMSEEAKQRFIDQAAHPPALGASTICGTRKAVDDWYGVRVKRAMQFFAVNIAQASIAGRPVALVTPREGLPVRNRKRVLINLHGGAFIVGAGNGALAESIPIAATGGFKVVSVDYRMAPEHRFPAASDDVVAVYRELLKVYQPRNIGIYGCSAGALLTAQVVAALQKANLPLPGAIGLFCMGADAGVGGDSRYLAASFDVSLGPPAPPPPAQPNPPALPMPYFEGASLRDPLVSPVVSRELLGRFPPTLLISGTRDLGLSSIAHTHAELVASGAVADLHVREGMGHNFLVEMDLPESRAAYEVIARHFDRYLGSASD